MTTTETNEQKLERIKNSGFGQNDALAIMHFDACGIPASDIDPKHNVLTFNAWKGAGRVVAKGANGCPLTIWIPKRGKQAVSDDSSDKEKAAGGMYPKTSRVFHISQTIPTGSKGIKVARDGTVKEWPETLEAIPTGWNNPALFKDAERELYAQAVARLSDSTEEAPHDSPAVLVDVHGMSEADNAEAFAVRATEQYAGWNRPGIVSEEVLTLDENGDLVPDDDDEEERARGGDDFGKLGDDRPQTCNCPMVGVVTNAACPLHGTRQLV